MFVQECCHETSIGYAGVEHPGYCNGKSDFRQGLECSGEECNKVFVCKLTGKDHSAQFMPSNKFPAYKCASNFLTCQWAYCNGCFSKMLQDLYDKEAGYSKRKRTVAQGSPGY